MKQIILLVVGAVALYQAAKRFNINSVQDVRDLFTKWTSDINLKEVLSLDKIKKMVGLEEPEMATL